MPHAIYIPRVNNNDDDVRLVRVFVRDGDPIQPGQQLAEVETDKASIPVEAERGGFVLRVLRTDDSMARVGSVLAWIGDSLDEAIPGQDEPAADRPKESTAEPTAKAKALLVEHGLRAEDVLAQGQRLAVDDVLAYLKSQSEGPKAPAAARAAAVPATSPPPASPASASAGPAASGRLEPLSMEARGMMRSVLWHRDEAVAAYLEIEYDPEPWEERAKAFAEERRMLGNPLLQLMAQRLAVIARDHPRLNSTIVDGKRFVYEHVNLGFTIQVQDCLYLVVVPRAEEMDPPAFVKALDQLHRKAIAHKLTPDDMRGATLAFSSMARWQVSRHIPILPPYISMIVAHTVSKDGRSVLGATYDHRVLSGGEAILVLDRLAQPWDRATP
jgi:pyruvate/2-oxoglutarate dehydrogenase complex dihydrolipoamide acyltransferase (E2) component